MNSAGTLRAILFLSSSFSFLTGFVNTAVGEERSDTTRVEWIREYISTTDTFLVVRLSLLDDVDYFEVKGADFRYDVRPNVRLAQKVSLSYRFINIGYSFYAPVFNANNDDDLKGKTRSFGISLNYLGKKWNQHLHYRRTKGYYLENTFEYVPGWNPGKDPYITFPDQFVREITGSTRYKFNPKLSVKAFVDQTEIQRKSAGSLLLTLHYRWLYADNQSDDPAQYSSQRSSQLGTQLTASWLHTFVLKHRWYVSLGLGLGGGFVYEDLLTRFPDGNVMDDDYFPVFRSDAMLGAGYNATRFFFGFQFSSLEIAQSDKKSGVTFLSDGLYSQAFFGCRFTTPKILKRAVQKIQDMSPVKIP